MKIATAGVILATVASSTEGKKSKTSNDFYNSKDGDRFAARYASSSSSSSSDSDYWWRGSSSWSGKAGKGGKSGSGSGSNSCRLRTYYLDLDDILDDVDTKVNKIDMTYTNYKVYKDEDDVGNSVYDGVLSLSRKFVSEFSCQAQGMLGLDGGPIFEDQIYFSSMCNPDENDPTQSGFITSGGITGGFGYYLGATGDVEYETSGDVGELKLWICLH